MGAAATVSDYMLCDVSRFITDKNIPRINHSNTVINRFVIRSEIPKNVNCVLHPSVFGRSYLEKTITYPSIVFWYSLSERIELVIFHQIIEI